MSELLKDSKQEVLSEKLKYISEQGLNLDKKVIYIFGELKDEIGTELRLRYDLLKQWSEMVEEKNITEITLDLSSFGGSIYAIYAALDFYYELGLEGVKVNTKAQGVCMSAATVLLAGGTGERVATPRCKFMLHDMQIEGVGGTASQVMNSVKNIGDEQTEMFQLYAEFSRKGKEPFDPKELIKEGKKWQKKFTKDSFDHYISSKDVLELNLIDRII